MDSNEGELVGQDAVPVLDSAMGTGSDEGAPGEDSFGPPLDEGEKELLNRLRSPDFGQDVPDADGLDGGNGPDGADAPGNGSAAADAPGDSGQDGGESPDAFSQPDGLA